MHGWEFWVDRGGTFTDIIAKSPDGNITTHKLLSENPEQYEDATVYGIRAITQETIESIKMGTTLATNALLERRGEKIVLATTQGFADALQIGYQNRPQLFATQIILPKPLYDHVIEIEQRINAQGQRLLALNQQRALEDLQSAYNQGYRNVAIVFMHSYLDATDELQVAALARKVGFEQITLSHQISPLIRLVERGDTAVVEAYLYPLLQRYIDHLSTINKNLFFMQSHGGLATAEVLRAKDSILSGPAAGVIASIKTSQIEGLQKIISFDMGGTSTDVAHYAGKLERASSIKIAGVYVRTSAILLHTIAAGGGSILSFKHQRYQVGPDSAGANPGPACYRRDGPLTVTDCNVILGRIQAKYFPSVFGIDGKQSIDIESARKKFATLSKKINQETGEKRTIEQVATGFLKIAVANMANAIKKISVQRGYDVTEYTLYCFGGAGGQHACAVAEELGIKQIYIHPLAGVLSALGMGLADLRFVKEQGMEQALSSASIHEIKKIIHELSAEGKTIMQRQGADLTSLISVEMVKLRYRGSDTVISVSFSSLDEMQKLFLKEHQQQFGFIMPDTELMVAAVEIEIISSNLVPLIQETTSNRKFSLQPLENVSMYSGDQQYETPLYQRTQLIPNDKLSGPAIVVDTYQTIVVDKGWELHVTAHQGLLLRRTENSISQKNWHKTAVDPIRLEIFNNLFMSIAEQMGSVLMKTAYSVNIKERQDFSCALFDAQGYLVANAPHMPVHLGSMSSSVQAVMKNNKTISPGDVYMLNDPYHGGTHLPDVTVITPVFIQDKEKPIFYVASRAHHADIGGITPGSIPAESNRIEEEGVLINNFKLVEKGVLRKHALIELLTSGDWPARNVSQNIADLSAQIAANQKGVNELIHLVESYTLPVVQAYMQHIQNNADICVRQVIDRLQDGKFTYAMDNGCHIQVQIKVDHQKRCARIDFSGTSAQQNNNFNAPQAITIAAVLYVFRCMVAQEIPLNQGCLRPLEIIIPEGSLLNPKYPAAVVAGNVETSQCIVDALFGAMQVMAASQGTMNNFTFGNEKYQYYETICGGAGAGPGFDGASAVHTHMTNTLLTDPEVLEFRYPVLVKNFAIRKESGGSGKWHGGNGVIRTLHFLQPMTVAIVANRRVIPPYGMAGGEPGQVGCNYLSRSKDNNTIKLPSTVQILVHAGDEITIETPGGGGYGD